MSEIINNTFENLIEINSLIDEIKENLNVKKKNKKKILNLKILCSIY